MKILYQKFFNIVYYYTKNDRHSYAIYVLLVILKLRIYWRLTSTDQQTRYLGAKWKATRCI